jgi:NAD(P)-dependent dehydrogenase (short-subunit alcohol dehydrogenase family)
MKSVLITGANRGIGLEHARRFAARGACVFATARAPAEATELAALAAEQRGRVEVLEYEASDPAAPDRLKAALRDTPIDLLLANAGALGGKTQSFGSVDVDSLLELVRVNALAPLKLAEVLADNVARSGRRLMAFQSSLMGSVGDNTSGGHYAYRVAKVALNMIAKSIAVDLRPRGVITVALHPGWVRTRMGGKAAPVSVEACVAGQQRLLDSLTLADSGRFLDFDGTELPW